VSGRLVEITRDHVRRRPGEEEVDGGPRVRQPQGGLEWQVQAGDAQGRDGGTGRRNSGEVGDDEAAGAREQARYGEALGERPPHVDTWCHEQVIM